MTRRTHAADNLCQVVTIDGEPVRVQGTLTTFADYVAFADIVRAARRKLEADVAPGWAAQLTGVTLLRSRWRYHHPRPLPIDGHAYHRRTRNRRKRR